MFPNLTFGYIDYIFLALLVLLCCNSFLKGFIHEALSIISLILSGFFSYQAQEYISILLAPYIHISIFLNIFSFIVAFFISYLVLSVLVQFIARRLQTTIGMTDRLLGIIFGIIKTLFIILIFYTVIDLLIPIKSQPEFLTKSFFKEIIDPIEKQLFYNINNDNMKV